MKMLALLMISTFTLSTQSFAQGISKNSAIKLKCELAKSYIATDELTAALKKKIRVIHCTQGKNTYEMALINAQLTLTQRTTDTQITLLCTNGAPKGIYKFGAMKSIGFNQTIEPWFYNTTAEGRCFLQGNTQVLASLKATQANSVMIIYPIK